MSGEHHEPWQYIHDELFDCHGDSICVVPEPGDAERIKACVNALDGVTTEAIEAGAVPNLVAALEACRDALSITASGKFKLECLNGAREALKPFEEIASE